MVLGDLINGTISGPFRKVRFKCCACWATAALRQARMTELSDHVSELLEIVDKQRDPVLELFR